MDPNQQPNTGSFMAGAGGGGNAIMAAMQRRGMVPPTSQVGGDAPGAQNAVQIPQVPAGTPAGLPNPMPAAQAQAAPQAAPQPAPAAPMGPPMSPTSLENQLIIKGLLDKLDGNAEVEKSQAGIHKSQLPPTQPGVSA